MNKWQFILMNNEGQPLAELTNLKERKVKLPLGRVPTGSFVVDASHPWANTFRKCDAFMIKAYRTDELGNDLMALGPIINTQKVRASGAGSQTGTIAINWAGIGWRLEKRLIEESKSSKGIEYGTATNPIETGSIPVKIIEGLNNAHLLPQGGGGFGGTGVAPTGVKVPYNVENPAPAEYLGVDTTLGPSLLLPQANTGIRIGTIGPTPKSAAGPWYFQNSLQAISLVAATFSGFDWEIEPVEPYHDATGIVFGKLNIGTVTGPPLEFGQPNQGSASFGQLRPNVYWEYGDGKNNVREFTDFVDATGNMNSNFSLPTGFPENATEEVLQQYDWTSIQERGCVYDDVVPSDIVAQELRNELLKEHIKVRRQPKTVITFKPTNDPTPGVTPRFGIDFDVGDVFKFRAVEFGEETFNGLVRMYSAEFEIDEIGNETLTPVLISQDV